MRYINNKKQHDISQINYAFKAFSQVDTMKLWKESRPKSVWRGRRKGCAVSVFFRITYLRRNNRILAAIRSVAFDVPDPARDKQFVRVQTLVGLKLFAGVRTSAQGEVIHNVNFM